MKSKTVIAYTKLKEAILIVKEELVEVYDLINKRAEVLYDILDDLINFSVDEIEDNAMDALKATFVLRERSISRFERAFAQFGLFFDVYDVEEYYERFSSELPGPNGMMIEEKELLEEVKLKLH